MGKDVFPKITAIPKGHRITPDIDLLEIRDYEKKVIGYEIKLLKYSAQKNDVPLTPLYAGLGQVLCYFQFGVDQVFLTLCICKIPQNRQGLMRTLETKLKEVCNFLERFFLNYSPYIGLELYRQDESYPITLMSPKQSFPIISDKEIEHRKECLIRRQFSWGNKWLKEMTKEVKNSPKPECFKKLPDDAPIPIQDCSHCKYKKGCLKELSKFL